MNQNQMAFRCPDAKPLEAVRLEGYRLAFCGCGEWGVATILPEDGSCVEGVLWQISARDEKFLDRYEGYPHLYEKKPVTLCRGEGETCQAMAYVMTSPSRDVPARPSPDYLMGILVGCRQNKIDPQPVMEAVRESARAQVLTRPQPGKRRGRER